MVSGGGGGWVVGWWLGGGTPFFAHSPLLFCSLSPSFFFFLVPVFYVFLPPTPCAAGSVVQTLLRAISHCQRGPLIPPELVQYIGKTFNVWHTSIDLLERRLYAGTATTGTATTGTATTPRELLSIVNSLQLLYTSLHESTSKNGKLLRR